MDLPTKIKGTVLVLLYGISIALITVCLKQVSTLTTPTVVALRATFQYVWALPITAFRHRKGASFLLRERWIIVATIAAAIASGGVLAAWSITARYLSIGDAVVFRVSSTIFIIVIGHFVFQEEVNYKDIGMMAIAVVGAFLLLGMKVVNHTSFFSGPVDDQKPLSFRLAFIGCLSGMAMSLLSAIVALCVRLISEGESTTDAVIVHILMIIVAASWPLAALIGFTMPSYIEIGYLVAIGILSYISKFLIVRAFQLESILFVEVVGTSEVVFGYALDMLIYRYIPCWYQLVGAGMVTGAVVSLAIRRAIASTCEVSPESSPIRRTRANSIIIME